MAAFLQLSSVPTPCIFKFSLLILILYFNKNSSLGGIKDWILISLPPTDSYPPLPQITLVVVFMLLSWMVGGLVGAKTNDTFDGCCIQFTFNDGEFLEQDCVRWCETTVDRYMAHLAFSCEFPWRIKI